MIKHILLFRLTSYSDMEEKKSQLEEMKAVFSAIPDRLTYITEYRTGINISEAGYAWDFVIDSTFGSPDDLKSYQESMEHREAVLRASRIGKIKAVVDYEI